VSVFYGSLKYGYKIDVSGVAKVIEHDVMSIHPIFLDAQARPNTRSGSGVYGVDWWNIYIFDKYGKHMFCFIVCS
jgi:hypothetical protein